MKIAVIYLGNEILSVSEKQEMQFVSSESDIVTGEENIVLDILENLGIEDFSKYVEFKNKLSYKEEI